MQHSKTEQAFGNLKYSTVFLAIYIFLQGCSAHRQYFITYVEWKDTVGTENRISLMRQDGSPVKTLIDYAAGNWMPLADARYIWLHVSKSSAERQKGLYKYNLKTGREQFLFDASGLYQDISFDEKSTLYAGGFSHKPAGSDRHQYDILLFNADGSYRKQVTSDTAIDLEPAFSPDGAHLVFRSNRDRNPASWGEFEIYLVNPDGTGLKRLTHNPDTTLHVLRAANPCWVSNDQIAFSGFWSGNYRIMIMNKDGSDLHPLLKTDDLEQMGFSFSPDRKKIAFTGRKKGARNFDIYTVNSDGSGLLQLTHDWKRKVQPFFVKGK